MNCQLLMALSDVQSDDSRGAKALADPTHPDFFLDNSPLYLMAQIYGRYTFAMERSLKAVGMDLPRWRVMMIVHETNPSSISEIADKAVMRLSTMTKVARRLADEGLLELAPRKSDGRITDARITPKGREAVEKIRMVAGRTFRQAFDDFDDEDVQVFVEMERRLLHNLSLLA